MPLNCMVDFAKGERSAFFESWSKPSEDLLEEENEKDDVGLTDIVVCLEFLRCCNVSLDILKDAGFESAIKYLAKNSESLAMVSCSPQ